MAIDLKTILADGEALFRSGASPDGAATAAYGRSLWAAASASAARTLLELGTSSVADLIDDDTFATASATNVPSAESVAAYVLANGGGDVSSSSSTVAPAGNYWDFVLDEDTLVSDSATKLATQQSIKAYIDALPTLTTSDTGLVPISTVGSVTTIDVSGLLTTSTAEFPDGSFAIENTGDATKRAVFSAAGITTATTRTYTLPDIAGGTLLLTSGTQTVTGAKTFSGGVKAVPTGSTYALSVNGAADTAITPVSSVQFLGNATVGGPTLQFLHDGGTASEAGDSPAQSANGALLGSIVARGHTGAARPSANAVRMLATAVEAVGASWGARWGFATTAIGGTGLLEAVRMESDQTLRVRNGVAINTGSAFAAPGTGIALDVLAGGLCAMRASTLALANGANANVTLPTSSVVVVTGPTGAFSLSGIAGGVDGMILYIINRTGQAFTLTNDATSTAANRILTMTGADQTTTTDGVFILVYDADAANAGANPRWVKVGVAV